MQNGGRAKGEIDEIDEYLKDPVEAVDTTALVAGTSDHKDGDTDREEVRRLTALVSHLRNEVRDLNAKPGEGNGTRRSRSSLPSIAFATLVGAGIFATVYAVQARTFKRH